MGNNSKYQSINYLIDDNLEKFQGNRKTLTRFILETFKSSLPKGTTEESLYSHVRRYLDSKDNSQKEESPGEYKSMWEENTTADTAYYQGTTTKVIKTLEDAIQSAGVDTEIWEVERWLANSWGVTSWKSGEAEYRTNYQVKLWLRKRQKSLEEILEPILDGIKSINIKSKKVEKRKVGVISFADFHIGADIKKLVRTPDFDINILLDYISQSVAIINDRNYSEVHVNLLGDFFESLSGMNHENVFKSLNKELIGANAIIMANEVIGRFLLGEINNLTSVNIVSGNHDRMVPSNKLETTGEGGKLLWYLLKKDFPNIEIDYHHSVLIKEIDGINYLLTHGDKGFSKKDVTKFLFDFGNTFMFNVVLEGHFHTRKSKKTIKKTVSHYEDFEYLELDELNYRKLNIPSMFTGNLYSENSGFGGNSGFIITENNGRGKIHSFDYCL